MSTICLGEVQTVSLVLSRYAVRSHGASKYNPGLSVRVCLPNASMMSTCPSAVGWRHSLSSKSPAASNTTSRIIPTRGGEKKKKPANKKNKKAHMQQRAQEGPCVRREQGEMPRRQERGGKKLPVG